MTPIEATINFSVKITAKDLSDLNGRMNLIGRALSEEGISYSLTPPEGSDFIINAKLVALTDSYKSEGVAPIYMLAFSSNDELTRAPQLEELVRSKAPVRILLQKIRGGAV